MEIAGGVFVGDQEVDVDMELGDRWEEGCADLDYMCPYPSEIGFLVLAAGLLEVEVGHTICPLDITIKFGTTGIR